MNPDQGFVDLRLNRQEGQTQDSFWPSFTDIMTVVLMIFMLAMVVLLLRNMELVHELRATMQAERRAAELARATGKQKDTLAGQLTAAKHQLARLNARVEHLEALDEQQEAAIASQGHQITDLGRERDRLQKLSTEQAARAAQLQSRLDSTRKTLDTLRTEHDATLARQAETGSELDRLKHEHAATVEALDTLRQAHARLQDTLQASRLKAQELDKVLSRRSADLVTAQAALAELKQQQSELQSRYEDAATGLKQARRDAEAGAKQLAATRESLAALKTRYAQARTAAQKLAERNRELDKTRETLEHLDSERTALLHKQAVSTKEADELRTRLAVQEQALAQAMARLKQANVSLSSLKQDYGNLKLKYDDLVKPARTAEGRFVAEVRVTKDPKGGLALRFRTDHSGDFRSLSRSELNAALERLKAAHPEGLYVRVIIPEGSGLSYSEAWAFTSDIHSHYDYYYQDRSSASDAAPKGGE
jgi:chromosome segregation ATPase